MSFLSSLSVLQLADLDTKALLKAKEELGLDQLDKNPTADELKSAYGPKAQDGVRAFLDREKRASKIDKTYDESSLKRSKDVRAIQAILKKNGVVTPLDGKLTADLTRTIAELQADLIEQGKLNKSKVELGVLNKATKKWIKRNTGDFIKNYYDKNVVPSTPTMIEIGPEEEHLCAEVAQIKEKGRSIKANESSEFLWDKRKEFGLAPRRSKASINNSSMQSAIKVAQKAAGLRTTGVVDKAFVEKIESDPKVNKVYQTALNKTEQSMAYIRVAEAVSSEVSTEDTKALTVKPSGHKLASETKVRLERALSGDGNTGLITGATKGAVANDLNELLHGKGASLDVKALKAFQEFLVKNDKTWKTLEAKLKTQGKTLVDGLIGPMTARALVKFIKSEDMQEKFHDFMDKKGLLA